MAPHLGDEVGAHPCLEAFLLEPMISFSSGCLGFLRVVIMIQKHVFQETEIWSELYIKKILSLETAFSALFYWSKQVQRSPRFMVTKFKPCLFKGETAKYFCRYLWWRKLEVKGSESQSVMSNSSWPHKLYSPWNSLGQNTGVGSLSLLQGIFLTQGSNPCLPHCRQILYQLSQKGSPRVLEWVAYPFSSDLPDPGNQPGSPALQADSLQTELSRKPLSLMYVL